MTFDPTELCEAVRRGTGGRWQWRNRLGRWIDMPNYESAVRAAATEHAPDHRADVVRARDEAAGKPTTGPVRVLTPAGRERPAIASGGWMKIKRGRAGGYTTRDRTGKRVQRGGRDVEVTASKRVFEYQRNPADSILGGGGANIPDGKRVRIAKLHGAPPPGTMGSYHVVDADSGDLLGLVSGGALRPAGRDRPAVGGKRTPELLDQFTERGEWNGWGYLGERENMSKSKRASADRAVLTAADELGWTDEQLFHWTNSKMGRHYADDPGDTAAQRKERALASMRNSPPIFEREMPDTWAAAGMASPNDIARTAAVNTTPEEVQAILANRNDPEALKQWRPEAVDAVLAAAPAPQSPQDAADAAEVRADRLMNQALGMGRKDPRSEALARLEVSPATVAELVRRVPPGGFDALSGDEGAGDRALVALDRLTKESRRAGLRDIGDRDLARLYLTAEDANYHTMNEDVDAELKRRNITYDKVVAMGEGRARPAAGGKRLNEVTGRSFMGPTAAFDNPDGTMTMEQRPDPRMTTARTRDRVDSTTLPNPDSPDTKIRYTGKTNLGDMVHVQSGTEEWTFHNTEDGRWHLHGRSSYGNFNGNISGQPTKRYAEFLDDAVASGGGRERPAVGERHWIVSPAGGGSHYAVAPTEAEAIANIKAHHRPYEVSAIERAGGFTAREINAPSAGGGPIGRDRPAVGGQPASSELTDDQLHAEIATLLDRQGSLSEPERARLADLIDERDNIRELREPEFDDYIAKLRSGDSEAISSEIERAVAGSDLEAEHGVKVDPNDQTLQAWIADFIKERDRDGDLTSPDQLNDEVFLGVADYLESHYGPEAGRDRPAIPGDSGRLSARPGRGGADFPGTEYVWDKPSPTGEPGTTGGRIVATRGGGPQDWYVSEGDPQAPAASGGVRSSPMSDAEFAAKYPELHRFASSGGLAGGRERPAIGRPADPTPAQLSAARALKAQRLGDKTPWGDAKVRMEGNLLTVTGDYGTTKAFLPDGREAWNWSPYDETLRPGSMVGTARPDQTGRTIGSVSFQPVEPPPTRDVTDAELAGRQRPAVESDAAQRARDIVAALPRDESGFPLPPKVAGVRPRQASRRTGAVTHYYVKPDGTLAAHNAPDVIVADRKAVNAYGEGAVPIGFATWHPESRHFTLNGRVGAPLTRESQTVRFEDAEVRMSRLSTERLRQIAAEGGRDAVAAREVLRQRELGEAETKADTSELTRLAAKFERRGMPHTAAIKAARKALDRRKAKEAEMRDHEGMESPEQLREQMVKASRASDSEAFFRARERLAVVEAQLSAKSRKSLPDSAFAIPEHRAYPIHDESHARNALTRVAQHGSPDEKRRVKAAVKRRHKNIDVQEAFANT